MTSDTTPLTDVDTTPTEHNSELEYIARGYALNYASVYPSDDDEMLVAEKTDYAMSIIEEHVKQLIGTIAEQKNSLLEKAVDLSGNEFAMGYNDSGCFWRFVYGSRGAGSMMDGWPQFISESPDVDEALKEYIAYRKASVTPAPQDGSVNTEAPERLKDYMENKQ